MTYDVFQERLDTESCSVDRLDFAPDSEMAEIADRTAKARSKKFFGWAVVTVHQASEMGRSVEATPLLDNPYHTDIFLNLAKDVDRRDAVRQHAYALARHAIYRSWHKPAAPR